MRSHLRIVYAILLTGLTSGSSVTQPSPTPIHTSLNAGDRLTVEVLTFDDVVTSCRLESPSGSKIEFKPNDESDGRFEKQPDTESSKCRGSIAVTENDTGLWKLASEAEDGRERTQTYNVTVNPESDPEDQKHIEYLNKIFLNTTIGSRHRITIYDFMFGSNESCQLITPTGEMIDVNKMHGDGINGTYKTADSMCSVSVFVASEDSIGDWMLISAAYRYMDKVERRFPFTIHVEKIVEAVPNEVNEKEGSYFYIAVKNFEEKYVNTCRLLGPKGVPPANYLDLYGCHYKVFNVTTEDSGNWEINYGDKIVYRAIFPVTVQGPEKVKDVENLDKIFINTEIGSRHVITIPDTYGHSESCQLIMPNGEKIDVNERYTGPDINGIYKAADSMCSVSVLVASKSSIGDWMLISVAYRNMDKVERRLPFTIHVESSEDPKDVENLDKIFINTEIGSRHTITIPDITFGDSESCQLMTSTGGMIDVNKMHGDGINGTYKTADSMCSVSVLVASEDSIGDWMLISVGYRYADKVERRLPFTIHVEKILDAVPREINVGEGSSFYIDVNNIGNEHVDTCRLLGPYKLPSSKYSRIYGCRYKVFDVTLDDRGDWEINYGDKIVYRAISRVYVRAASNPSPIYLTWTKDRPVEETLGSEHAVYCRIRSPKGYVVYDGFGRCRIVLDRAIKSQHEGVWKMEVGMPGQVLTDSYSVNVVVQEAAPKPTVTTRVIGDSPDDVYMKNMSLSCYLESPDPIGFCKFRDPSGRILIAAEAVGQSRYSWHGAGTNYTAGIHAHDCGIRISNTTLSDFGIWRCEIDTKGGTYYGFLTARATWIRDPEIAATITTVPTLTADRSSISSLSDDSVTLTCSIQAPIRYCYFRARNGTLFNVAPSDSHDFATYVGAGFEAGECGIRFPSLATSDSGYWSCHVGLLDPQEPEQRARFEVTINDTMVVRQSGPVREDDRMLIEGQVNNERPLDYCRFVRIDGFGFTGSNMPANVQNWSHLSKGLCAIMIRNPTHLDQHPWAIVARIRGQDTEVTRLTDIAFPIPNPPRGSVQFRIPGAWIIVMTIGMCMILLASFIGPKKNREWTYARASAIRNSFMTKKAQQGANNASQNTAVAA